MNAGRTSTIRAAPGDTADRRELARALAHIEVGIQLALDFVEGLPNKHPSRLRALRIALGATQFLGHVRAMRLALEGAEDLPGSEPRLVANG